MDDAEARIMRTYVSPLGDKDKAIYSREAGVAPLLSGLDCRSAIFDTDHRIERNLECTSLYL